MTPSITVARSAPSTADAIGLAVGPSGAVPRTLGLNRTTLKTHGFNGKPGDLLVIPAKDAPTMVAIGVGDKPTAATLRNAAARFVRAVPYAANLATNLAGSSDADLAQAVVEGALLARYRYVDGPSNGATPINSLTLVSNATTKTSPGAQRGAITAGAAMRARDLANTPPNKLTARDFAAQASKIAEANGLDIEIFDADALAVMGCGGLLGVNAGSVEPPRMVKLSYTPSKPKAHVALVGKGVMYDSGGISLKPSNASHIAMPHG
ncbi:MAG: hypothetical protein CSA55_03260 [Ilumatobacter coccineus]|uniref:Probable cytosol aminopeptidase n=1 Tax=Ilumatobacter coccineus TaxID=467094 RepID=A0A2G6KA37_9ACTN|nr:MAG: hypothetical protein CSA55_03260 [Ilumatobacter coccineus]